MASSSPSSNAAWCRGGLSAASALILTTTLARAAPPPDQPPAPALPAPALPAPALPASALPAVDVALVLLTDVSRSIDDSEFALEKQGTAAAFDAQVIAAIQGGPLGRIAVAYVEFAGAGQVCTVVDWTIIDSTAAAQGFTQALTAAPRSFYGRTAIGSAIEEATRLLANTAFAGARTVIDVAGDGTNNAGTPVEEARDAAVEAGITINGLAIINDHPVSFTFAHTQPPGGLTQWYRDNVTGGLGSFVLEVHDFQTFGRAMARKLLSEIAGLPRSRL